VEQLLRKALAHQLFHATQKGDGAAVTRVLVAGADPNALVSTRGLSGQLFEGTALLKRLTTYGLLDDTKQKVRLSPAPLRA
jgi:hypothetical protein